MRIRNRKWSAEDDQLILRMLAQGSDTSLIASRLSRTPRALACRVRWLRMTPDEQAGRRKKAHKRNVAKRPIPSRYADEPTQMFKVKHAVFAERDRRLAIPEGINQVLFGDPLPGYSALDRRQREE